MKRIQFLLALTSIILITACNNKVQEEQEKSQNRLKIETVIAKTHDYAGQKQFSGNFMPFKEANLGTSLPGKVEKIYFPEGAYVKEGDLLVQLSSELLIQVEIEYNTLTKDFERVSNLKRKNSISDQEFDHVKAKYDASKAKYEMVLKNTEIRAPFSGIITNHLVQEGENYFLSISTDPGYSLTSGIIRLMQTSPLLFEIEVGEKDLPFIKTGQAVQIESFAYPEETIEGQIYKIAPALSTVSKTATISIMVSNPGGKIKPGMGGTAQIELPSSEAIYIPQSATRSELGSNTNYVFVIENNIAYKRNINIIGIDGDNVAVSGINSNDEVAITGISKLKDAMPVEIIK
jgi:membrane fusion protein (multidrug efflux system)